jgi:naphthoate synthase
MKGHSGLTIRMTKRSLNFESDMLYASWQHGMELLAHVWGSDEAKEGMDAFLAGRKPDFQKFRMRDKKELERYIEGYERDENAPPAMRSNGSGKGEAKKGQKTVRRKNGKSARAAA